MLYTKAMRAKLNAPLGDNCIKQVLSNKNAYITYRKIFGTERRFGRNEFNTISNRG